MCPFCPEGKLQLFLWNSNISRMGPVLLQKSRDLKVIWVVFGLICLINKLKGILKDSKSLMTLNQFWANKQILIALEVSKSFNLSLYRQISRNNRMSIQIKWQDTTQRYPWTQKANKSLTTFCPHHQEAANMARLFDKDRFEYTKNIELLLNIKEKSIVLIQIQDYFHHNKGLFI